MRMAERLNALPGLHLAYTRNYAYYALAAVFQKEGDKHQLAQRREGKSPG
jgi:hypothetical protein